MKLNIVSGKQEKQIEILPHDKRCVPAVNGESAEAA